MLTSPEILSRQPEQERSAAPSLRDRVFGLLGLSDPKIPILDPERVSERMLKDLNLPAGFRPSRDPRERP